MYSRGILGSCLAKMFLAVMRPMLLKGWRSFVKQANERRPVLSSKAEPLSRVRNPSPEAETNDDCNDGTHSSTPSEASTKVPAFKSAWPSRNKKASLPRKKKSWWAMLSRLLWRRPD